MSANQIIKIHSGCSCGHLQLSDSGFTGVYEGSDIEWVIEPKPGPEGSFEVKSLESIEVERTDQDVFVEKPKKENGKIKAKIKKVDPFTICKYNITWKGTDTSKTYVHDPIIAVLPKPFMPPEK